MGNEQSVVLAGLIERVPVFMLTVRTADGSLRSTPAARVHLPFDGSVWVFLDSSSAASAALTSPCQVNLNYADVTACSYVSLSGIVSRVVDPEVVGRLWKNDYREWLPRGVEDPAHGLYQIQVEHAEYWDAAHSAMRQMGGLMKGLFTGHRPAVGDHSSIDLPVEARPQDQSSA